MVREQAEVHVDTCEILDNTHTENKALTVQHRLMVRKRLLE